MSALSEASTPAQEAGTASIDTQQLQQLAHNGDPSQSAQSGQSVSGGETGRKRVSAMTFCFGSGGIHKFFLQQKHRL